MLETDKLNSQELDRAEIAEAQRRLIQLLAKAVAERLVNQCGTSESVIEDP